MTSATTFLRTGRSRLSTETPPSSPPNSGWRRSTGVFLITLLLLSMSAMGATFTVTNTNDAGPGSFRQAIIDANALAGADVINFNIPGAGPHVISVLSGYPNITGQVFIDGWSQPGWGGTTPVIEVNGTAAPITFGLNIQASNTVVRGLALNNFPSGGVGNAVGIGVFTNISNVWIYGCHLGVDASGMIARPNGQFGMWIGAGPTGVLVGTNGDGVNDAIERNVISANLFAHGIFLQSNGNTIAGNYIGVAVDGTTPMGNQGAGIFLLDASNNTIGGTTTARRNIISSNGTDGVVITGGTSNSNSIIGNYIGVDASGTLDRGNGANGVLINGVAANSIGGTAAGSRNIISGNDQNGVRITGAGATVNTVAGNYIGLNAAGTANINNNGSGVLLTASGNTVGGTAAGARNVISGFLNHGVYITSQSAQFNRVQGNFIGTDATGLVGLGTMSSTGILVENASNITVGGSVAGAGNVVARSYQGIYLSGTTTGSTVQGNLVGTNATGTAALPNVEYGIVINNASGNSIGGTTALARNVSSGNPLGGIVLFNAPNSTILGNFLGTDITGTSAIPNGEGILVWVTANATIGGTTAGSGNLISGNTNDGIRIIGASSTNTQIQGNLIGTNVTGTGDLGNGGSGIFIDDNSSHVIGGNTAGARNIISGNNQHGVRLRGPVPGLSIPTTPSMPASINTRKGGDLLNGGGLLPAFSTLAPTVGSPATTTRRAASDDPAEARRGEKEKGGSSILTASGMVIQGNYIGTDVTGTVSIGNSGSGVLIDNATTNLVGGTTAAERNIISANGTYGVHITGSGSTDNVVRGNYIGTDVSGTLDLGNLIDGIRFELSPSNNTIGGTAAGAGNVISGNDQVGLRMQTGSTTNTVQGNYIGTNAAGTAAIPNVWGVYLYQSTLNTIGGSAAGAGNLISGNTLDGLTFLEGSNNAAQGNRIGTNAAGTADLGNGRDGILVEQSVSMIGGNTAVSERNLISGNNRNGLLIRGTFASGTVVFGNYIGTNAAGTGDIGNSFDGVYIDGSSMNIIGTSFAGARNVISGNDHDGVSVNGASSTMNSISGNIIGLNATGTAALGNTVAGVAVHSGAASTSIGGPLSTFPNIISGNGAQGIFTESNTSSNFIGGNLVGTDITGNIDLGNGSHGIHVTSPSTIVGGGTPDARNIVSGNNGDGIQFFGATANNGFINGNIVGLNMAGTTALGNSLSGIAFVNGPTDNFVGGGSPDARNIVSGNAIYGIYTDGATINIGILDNYIGTDITGTLDRGNGSSGIYLGGAGHEVGGPAAGMGNLISGNNFDGIILNGATSYNHEIYGNIIGLDASGTTALGNSFAGIGLHAGANTHRIGGTTPETRNIISGNGREGIWTEGNVSAITITGNYIGTDITGTVARGNAFAGVELRGFSSVVGGPGAGERNIISGNGASGPRAGVFINGALASNNIVSGNYIGTAVDGTTAMPNNLQGVLINAGTDNMIGGTAAGTGNVIAFNGLDGVAITGGTRNAVLGNSMFSNTADGIDLANDGITANDAGDPDVGPNNLQNYPVVSAASLLVGGDVSMTYSVNSTAANSAYPLRVEIFASDGAREGRTLMAADNYTMPSSNRTLTFTPPASMNAGDEIVLTATDANGNSSEFSAEVGLAPTIITHPSNLTVCQGQSASFTVTTTGTNLSYQWQKNNVNIPGAQSQTYTIASAQPVDAASYRVIVGSAANPGAFTVTSNSATLTVNTPPTIVAQPANVSVCEGAPTFIAVVANGTNLTYQWRKNGADIPGATLGSYYIPAASASDVASYDVVISGTCAPAVTSNPATLTLLSAPAITSQPAPQTVCQGQTATFTVGTTGSNLTYQWRRNGVNIGGAVGQTLVLANAQPAQAGTYDVVVSGSCAPSTTSSGASLTVNSAPAITAQPTPSITCQGVPVTFSVGATGAGLTYQWRKNGVNIGGATSATYTIASPQPADAGFYSVLVSGTCAPAVPSNTAQLTVNTAPVVVVQPAPVTVCQGASSSFTVTATGTGPFSYQWRKNGSDIPGATAQTYTIPSTQPADAGSYSVVVSGVCAPAATSSSVALTVNTAPVITAQPANVTTCQNSPASFTVTATGTGPFTYQWRKGGVAITGATAQTYTIPSVQPADAGQYDVIVGGTCAPPATSAIATLTVNTPPSITSMTPSSGACINTPFTFSVTASGTGPLTYQWRRNGVNIAGATSTTYTIASVQPAHAGDYTVVVTGLCAPPATSSVSTLTVNMPPAITQQPAPLTTVCEGQAATFTVGATGAGLTYQWRKNGVPIVGATSSSYTINPTTLNDAAIYTVVVNGSCLPSPMISSNAQLVVNALPRITAGPLSQTVCRTNPVTFTVTATGTGLSYQWRRNGIPIAGATSSSFTIASVETANAGNYDVVVSGTCAPPAFSAVATLTVNVEPTLFKWSESQTVAPGRPVTLSIIATGTALRYQWYKGNQPIPGATQPSYTINSVQTSDAGLYAVEVINMCAIPSQTSGGIFLFVGDGTTLAAMPEDQTVCSGATAEFVAPGDDGTFSYQWKRNGQVIAGQTSSRLRIPNADVDDQAAYTVTIIDRATGMTLELRPAQLTVVTGTEITASPSSATFCLGDNVRLEVAARGAGLRYQWRRNGIAIPGATTATFSPGPAAENLVGHYDVVVTGSCGEPVTSQIAQLDVDQPARITRQSGDTVVHADQQLTLSVEALGSALEYQWRKDGIDIAGANEATYTINRVLPRDSGRYDVVVRAECGVAATSRVIALRVEGVSVVTGMPELATGASLRTLPHPAYGQTRLELKLPATAAVGEGTRLVLVDLFGREALDLSASFRSGSYRTAEFDASVVASGMYSVRVIAPKYTGVVGTIVVRN